MGKLVLVAALLCACWTGAPPPETLAAPPKPQGARFVVKLERTACLGSCPAYTVTIYGDGRVVWRGTENVAELGHRERRVATREIERLDKAIDRVQFFARDERGELPAKPACTTTGGTTECAFEASFSVCSDTSHSIISVMRDSRTHRIEQAHCDEINPLDELEQLIDHLAGLDDWIGR